MFVRFIPCNYKQTSKAFFFPLVFFFLKKNFLIAAYTMLSHGCSFNIVSIFLLFNKDLFNGIMSK